jgi:hypothetical protein
VSRDDCGASGASALGGNRDVYGASRTFAACGTQGNILCIGYFLLRKSTVQYESATCTCALACAWHVLVYSATCMKKQCISQFGQGDSQRHAMPRRHT